MNTVERFATPALELEQPTSAKRADYNARIEQHPICAQTLEGTDVAFCAEMEAPK